MVPILSPCTQILVKRDVVQMQGNENELVGYHSKRLPDAVSRYSISELELTGLASNISGFKHLLSRTEFTVYVDHSTLCHILKAKRQALTLRLRTLKLLISLAEMWIITQMTNMKSYPSSL